MYRWLKETVKRYPNKFNFINTININKLYGFKKKQH